jgi:hypothetical protein
MQFSTVKSVIIGVTAAAAVIAITGAASGSGIGSVFNLGNTNKVNATSSLTGSTKHPMLSVTNKGTGTALSLQVAKGKAPLTVNSSVRVSKLNASLLGGLAAGSFVQGGGQSRSFGFAMSTASNVQQKLLSVPGFGTLTAFCAPFNGGFAEVDFLTGSHTMDKFEADIQSNQVTGAGNGTLVPNTDFLFAQVTGNGVTGLWERQILRYTTGPATHIATLDVMVDVSGSTCDFDATAIIGPGVSGP